MNEKRIAIVKHYIAQTEREIELDNKNINFIKNNPEIFYRSFSYNRSPEEAIEILQENNRNNKIILKKQKQQLAKLEGINT